MKKEDVLKAIAPMNLSGRACDRVASALSGWHGPRILAAHGGDVLDAARALESVRNVRGNAHRANLAAVQGVSK